MDEVTVFMPLLDEGTIVWRPVQALHLGRDHYRIIGNVPADEKWTYEPGSIVRCEHKTFADDTKGLVPVEALNPRP
ncbi:MAG: hypothetical protein ACLQUZ_15490 [Rhizomicrobium sp.]